MPRPPGDRNQPATPQLPVERQRSTRWRILFWAAIVVAFVIVGGREAYRILYDPEVYFLRNEAGAEWIRADEPFLLGARRASQTATVFECRFTTAAAVPTARLTVRAFRRCLVELDGKSIPVRSNEFKDWKEPHELATTEPVSPGAHRLQIAVLNFNAHPCLLAQSDDLDIRTGAGWFVVGKDGKRVPAVSAAHARLPDDARLYPSVPEAFVSRAPWLAAIFLVALAWMLWNSRATHAPVTESRWRVTPARLRWVYLAAWVVLAANNIWQIRAWVGPDLVAHFQYIVFIAQHRSLPLATDGWEMFQSPLFYSIAAPWYGLLSPHVGDINIVKILRLIPLLCGLAQIEIVYRTSLLVFPEKKDLQMLATTIGGLLPINIYCSQVIGNEPLAGCLTSLLILLSVSLLVEPARQRSARYFVVMGLVWGLAILAKVTPLILAPLLIGAIVVYCRNVGARWQQAFVRVGLTFGACFLTAGWWFLRNWVLLGKPIASSQIRGNVWWQDPSYRTAAQLSSLGISLTRPIYGAVWSLWDTLYSSLWLDGTVSGLVIGPQDFPWNVNWMLTGAWLGLVPMALLLFSPAASLERELRPSRDALLFALGAVAIYLAATVDLYIGLPVLSTAKSTYLVGLLPCFGLLAAAGAARLLRHRILRAVVFSAITCWAIAAYVSYFSIAYFLHGWEKGPS